MHAKCTPVCPFENNNCCMARILRKQADFLNQPSMLEILFTEAGHYCIFLPKLHCELNPIEMYWGWVKYRFREVPKKTFQDAKDAAFKYLDACPIEVIQQFINRALRWMSAYQLGLTGKAAEWAVKKQKTHWYQGSSGTCGTDLNLTGILPGLGSTEMDLTQPGTATQPGNPAYPAYLSHTLPGGEIP
ncbi:hypothetical protein BT96DRAFT_981389 [Gymnopus androsaceus JB14]|uniref:Tc1-like transposase DDE domain-containing protein n=1 Tax=Gymnopus androsaceus JB14 TaxID=1447944 RepID=A0A6A4GQ27_9AGAR|nr:hypothetical protein BT96DRAFT_981389 [Gymnopus androsaceus JB14]